jgi:hypothetical protein
MTTARPDDKFTTTETLLPVRARIGGRWQALNPRLSRAPGGRIRPAVTTASVSLSAGGTSPLAQIASLGRILSVTLPGTLPAPTLSGATATYAGYPSRGTNLIVTVNSQGDVSTVIEVSSAAAAASPAIRSLTMTASAPGLTLSKDSAGDLSLRASPAATPAFTALAPQMWDSAPLPAGTHTVTDPTSGEVLAAGSGMPAVSGPSGPGEGAHVTTVPVAVSGSSITLSPPAAALTGSGVTYPVFIDPNWVKTSTKNAAAWTDINNASPGTTTGDWMEKGCLNGNGGPCLKVGFCDPSGPYMGNCSGQVWRTMFRMSLPTGLPTNLTVSSADLYVEDVWTVPCDAAEKLQFWTTGAISSGTDWNNSSWEANQEDESFKGYGNPCEASQYGYSKNDVVFGTASGTKSGVSITGGAASNLADVIQGDLDRTNPVSNQTFGLRASNEDTTPCNWNYSTNVCTGGTAAMEWRQFMNTSGSMELQFTWYNPPDTPKASGMSSSPGGACSTNAAHEAQIGNDDVTLSATGTDADGDPSLTTTIKVYAYDTNNLVDTLTAGPGGEGQKVQAPVIPRATIQGWQANGKTSAYRYYYKAQTYNQDYPGTNGDKSQISGWSSPCYFFYNPSGPSQPLVTVNGQPFPSSVSLGQTINNVTFAPGSTGCGGSSQPSTCPVSYTYQVGTSAPITVSPTSLHSGTWSSSTDSWTGPVFIGVLGPFDLTVTTLNGVGNPGEASINPSASTSSATLADGYATDGSYPDLLFTGTGSKPSLWLAQGSSNGHVGTPVDIGGLGNAIFGGNSSADGPGDWKGALILHGDLFGHGAFEHGVEDVMAYWPTQTAIGTATIPAGSGMILAGTGAANTLSPASTFWGSIAAKQVSPTNLCDFNLDGCAADEPIDLIAAGNASQQGTGIADLIGILGDPTNGWELALYTSGEPGGYLPLPTVLSGTTANAPDGSRDWNNYSFATVQLPDAANPNGDPANTALLALDKATGALYQSTNPNAGNPPAGADCINNPASCTLVGTSASTWQQITTPSGWPTASQWSSGQASLLSADVNNGANGPGSGSTELWTLTGSTVASWKVAGTTSLSLQQEATGAFAMPSNDWPANDGDSALGGTATTATDTITGNQTSVIGGSNYWAGDTVFSTVLDTTNSPGSTYLAPPPATLSSSPHMPLSISLWFKTTSHDGVLASIQKQALSVGNTVSGGYDPVLYVGNDGKLYGEWWTGSVAPIASGVQVDDGLWHHAVLTAVTSGGITTQTLYLDGKQVGSPLTGTVDLAGISTTTNLTLGAGYIGGPWPHENYNGKTSTADYLNGQITDVTLTQ